MMVLPGPTTPSYTIQCSSAGQGLVILISVTERVSSSQPLITVIHKQGGLTETICHSSSLCLEPSTQARPLSCERVVFTLSVKPGVLSGVEFPLCFPPAGVRGRVVCPVVFPAWRRSGGEGLWVPVRCVRRVSNHAG